MRSEYQFVDEKVTKKKWKSKLSQAEPGMMVLALNTYLSGGDHDTDLLDSLGELIRLHSAVIVQIEVLEGLEEDSLLVGGSRGLLGKLLLQALLKAA